MSNRLLPYDTIIKAHEGDPMRKLLPLWRLTAFSILLITGAAKAPAGAAPKAH